MALPLCLFAFGDKGLALAIVFFAVFSTLQFTVGVSIAAGSFEPGRLLLLPLIYAVAVALAFVMTGIPVPARLTNSADLIGRLAIPLMLISSACRWRGCRSAASACGAAWCCLLLRG